jgi:hypothetical protein
MTRENKYIIEITFESIGKAKLLYKGQVPYYGSASFQDSFTIKSNKITIEANRSSVIQIDNIFYNHFSSIYNQIIKSLLYYYATTKKFVEIISIEIIRERNNKVLDNKKFRTGDFNQVLGKSFKLSHTIEQAKLLELFQEDPKGTSTLICISYILKANSGLSDSDKFEKLWKAFNKLYTLIGNHNKDFNCLRNLRQFVIYNPTILSLSSRKVNGMTSEKLRDSIRLRAMLLDIFDTEVKTEAFRDFVIRYSDKRIMEMLLESKYGYREVFLQNRGLLAQVDTHIRNAINANTIVDNEIVSFLTGKYMYFVRNKTFHGEKIDSSFRLSVNKEDSELKFLNSILEPYLIDLINANDLY